LYKDWASSATGEMQTKTAIVVKTD
jgi:hypothetical protein